MIITLNDIVTAVSIETQRSGDPGQRISEREIRSTTRGTPAAARARRLAMWLYHASVPDRSLSEVGRAFDRDRTTIREALIRHEAENGITGGNRAAVLVETKRRLGLGV